MKKSCEVLNGDQIEWQSSHPLLVKEIVSNVRVTVMWKYVNKIILLLICPLSCVVAVLA